MAGTNFQQWNPTQANQENDQQYTADPQRQGGYGNKVIVPSVSLNKVLYQVSTFAAAFGIMMANKGYSLSDGDVNVLAGVLANIFTDADATPGFFAYGYAPNVQVDLSAAETLQVFLGGDVNISFKNAQTNLGRKRLLAFVQDGTGGHSVNWPTGDGPGNVQGWSQPVGDANTVSVQEFYIDGGGTLRAITAPSITPA